MHNLMAEPDHTAMPKLVERGEKFDSLSIDGYHSFDYALIDFFVAGPLLRVGGVIAPHDSSYPAAYKVCLSSARSRRSRSSAIRSASGASCGISDAR